MATAALHPGPKTGIGDDRGLAPGTKNLSDRVLSGLSFALSLLPFRAMRLLGVPLGWLAGSVLRIRRAHVERAMQTAGIAAPSKAAAAMYRALGASIFELLWSASRRGPLSAVATIDAASLAAIAEARARGRGLVFAASHTGNWELAACRMAEEGDSGLSAITKPLSVGSFHRFTLRARARRNVRVTHAAGAATRARDVLRAEGAVAMVLDQVPLRRRHGVVTEFLGAPAFVDRAPAAVAAESGAPLVVTASRRRADGIHTVDVLRVLVPPRRAGVRWVREATCEATRALDQFVRTHPSEWLWMHRRWATPKQP